MTLNVTITKDDKSLEDDILVRVSATEEYILTDEKPSVTLNIYKFKQARIMEIEHTPTADEEEDGPVIEPTSAGTGKPGP